MLTVATANVGNQEHNVTRRQQLAGLRWLIEQANPDVVLLQEALPWLPSPTRAYRMQRFAGPSAHQQPILLRRSLPFAGVVSELVHDGRKGAWPSKHVTGVRLGQVDDAGRHIGRATLLLNVHVNSGIETAGRPRAGVDETRLLGARINIRKASRLGAVLADDAGIIGGDWNVHAGADHRERWPTFPAARMAVESFRDAWHSQPAPRILTGTLGDRVVDRLFHNAEVEPSSYRIMPRRLPFDHRWPVVRFDYA